MPSEGWTLRPRRTQCRRLLISTQRFSDRLSPFVANLPDRRQHAHPFLEDKKAVSASLVFHSIILAASTCAPSSRLAMVK